MSGAAVTGERDFPRDDEARDAVAFELGAALMGEIGCSSRTFGTFD
jgi:hypothetical protein